MPSETEALAVQLVRALYDVPDGRPMQWRTGSAIDSPYAKEHSTKAPKKQTKRAKN
jgi:hypothetical protein